jgi:hypothetical protein
MPLCLAVHADANWLAGVNEGDFSKFLSLVNNDSLSIDEDAVDEGWLFAGWNFPVPRLIDSPSMNGLLLVPSNQAFADFEAR